MARQQGLADDVVDLVRAGVIQIFAFQVNLRTTEMLRPAAGVINRAGATDIVLEFIRELRLERRIILEASIRRL